jgi:hypothetical protein
MLVSDYGLRETQHTLEFSYLMIGDYIKTLENNLAALDSCGKSLNMSCSYIHTSLMANQYWR